MTIPHMLTVIEAAQILRVSTKTMCRMIQTDEIKCVRVRGQYRISSLDIISYLEKGGSSAHER